MSAPLSNVEPLVASLTPEKIDQAPAASGPQNHLLNGPEWIYRLRKDGVEWRDDSGDASEWRRLCDPIEVAADTRDSGSENWGRLLVFEDRDGVRHEWAAPTADLARAQSGEVIVYLTRPLVVSHHRAIAPDDPGIGVTFDLEILEPYEV